MSLSYIHIQIDIIGKVIRQNPRKTANLLCFSSVWQTRKYQTEKNGALTRRFDACTLLADLPNNPSDDPLIATSCVG